MSLKKIFTALICCGMLFTFTGCDVLDYKSALSMMENSEWTGAREIFSTLGDYKDSQAMLTECDYNIALGSMENEDYEQAIEQFETLGNYKDCAELMTECTYLNAKSLYEQAEYSSAMEIFQALADYEDSEKLMLECTYLNAVAMYENSKYEEALSEFKKLEDYGDASRYIVICSLLTDQNGFMDGFISEMEKCYDQSGLPYWLEEDFVGYERDERDFIVSGDICSGSTYVIFTHQDKDGASYARGQINGITVLGNASSPEEILIVYPEFVFSAGIMLNALDDSTSAEDLILMLNGETEKLITNGPTEGNTAIYEFEYEGYHCQLATLIIDDFTRFVLTATVTELVS